MRQTITRVALSLLLTGVGAGAGCRPAGQGGGGGGQQPQQRAQIEALARKRQVRESTFSTMNTQQLTRELAVDSRRGLEPYNSLPYRLLVGHGPAAAADLKASLTAADRSSLLGLLALRQIDSAQYFSLAPAFRTRVLVDALDSARTFNTWGLPHLYWEAAARALIGEGRAGAEALRPLLKDCRPAPMWGSEEVMESQRYQYRLCDYAWAMLVAARGEKLTVPLEPEARDRLIQQLTRR
jgi:hypothetical protein